MDSESSNSTSLFELSFGTEGQPIMFRYIENQKWRKLRRMLKRSNGKDLCRERDDSGLTLVGMALGFEAPLDIIKSILNLDPSQINATDFFGATPLHVACLNAAPLDAVKYLIRMSKQNHAKTRDKDLRVPLHHAVECLCRNEIDVQDGALVIEMLTEAAPDAIHAADKHNDSPLDLVQLARMEVREESEEFDRLSQLYSFLRQISVQVYKKNKEKWENKKTENFSEKDSDSKSRTTKSTQETSVTSSHVTMFSNRDTIGDMEISFVPGDESEDNKIASKSEAGEKKQKSKRRFWKK